MTGAALTDAELERRERRRRCLIGGALLAAIPVTVAVPGLATADAGATVGAVVAGFVLLALVIAVWPTPWGAAERRHRRLQARWRSTRTDADVEVPWTRWLTWAEADGTDVVLSLIERPPGRPERFEERVVRRLEPDDVAAAAEAMEELRQRTAEREAAARDGWHATAVDADRRRHEQTLRAIEAAAREDLARREARLRAEVAEEQRAERGAQARAVAEALRRP